MEEEKEPLVIDTLEKANKFLYSKPYFAFLDILGFKALVKNNTHEKLVEIYNTLFSAQVETVAKSQKDQAKRQAEKFKETYTDAGLQIINISDSILIWTQHGQPSALFELTMAVSTLLGLSFVQGIPLRGCITRQPFSVIEKDKVTSVIGKGLVHAYGMENIQQWSGCIIDEEIINYFRDIEHHFFNKRRIAPLEKNRLVYEYEIPLKNLKAGERYKKKGYAVNWFEKLLTEEMIRSSFEAHNKKDDRKDSDTPEKIDNTVAFYEFCKAKQDEYEQAMDRFAKFVENMKSEGSDG